MDIIHICHAGADEHLYDDHEELEPTKLLNAFEVLQLREKGYGPEGLQTPFPPKWIADNITGVRVGVWVLDRVDYNLVEAAPERLITVLKETA